MLIQPVPPSKGRFSDGEALDLARQYLRDPSALCCPRCQTDTMEVIGFLDPDTLHGIATLVPPEGNYAIALYCHGCQHSIGLVLPDPDTPL